MSAGVVVREGRWVRSREAWARCLSIRGRCQSCTGFLRDPECGSDPETGASCGDCGAGEACSLGRCVQESSRIPIVVPDGQGGQRELEPLDPPSETTVGALPGSSSVSDRGSASYKIPIDVPPRRLGLQPELSLSYTGTVANGHLGVGWELEGLSVIMRCSKTVAMDGKVRPILGDDEDGFCIDGKRF